MSYKCSEEREGVNSNLVSNLPFLILTLSCLVPNLPFLIPSLSCLVPSLPCLVPSLPCLISSLPCLVPSLSFLISRLSLPFALGGIFFVMGTSLLHFILLFLTACPPLSLSLAQQHCGLH